MYKLVHFYGKILLKSTILIYNWYKEHTNLVNHIMLLKICHTSNIKEVDRINASLVGL